MVVGASVVVGRGVKGKIKWWFPLSAHFKTQIPDMYPHVSRHEK